MRAIFFLELRVTTNITWNAEYLFPYQEKPFKHLSHFLLGHCLFSGFPNSRGLWAKSLNFHMAVSCPLQNQLNYHLLRKSILSCPGISYL